MRPVAFKAFDWNYLEFIHAVPYTRFKGRAEPLVFSPKLFLDDGPPTWLGWLYGLDKQLMSFAATHTSQAVSRRWQPDRVVVEALWRQRGGFEKPAAVPTFAPLAKAMGQRLVGNKLGVYLCSVFNWGLSSS